MTKTTKKNGKRQAKKAEGKKPKDPKRVEAAKKAAAAVGATIKEIVWTQGQNDMVAIIEVSDEVAANAFALNTLKQGNVRAQTLRAFTAAEMTKILEHVA